MSRVVITLVLLALTAPLAGCYVAPAYPYPPGYCANHPYRCGYRPY
jgi:hypothetical protein